MSLPYTSFVVFILLPAVARCTQFDAPPLVQADVGVDSIFLIGTVVQLVIAIVAIFRTKARLPAVGIIAALTLLFLRYVIDIVAIVKSFSADFDEAAPSYFSLSIASTLFDYWVDAAVFVAIALVLHNRYRSAKDSSHSFIGFASAFGFLLVMMVVLVAAEVGIDGVLNKQYPHGVSITGGQAPGPRLDAFNDYTRRVRLSNNIFYAFVAFYILSTIFLAVCVFLLRNRTRGDTIMSLMVFAITPLLLLRAFIRLLFIILQARLPFTIGYNLEVRYGLLFGRTFFDGMLYLGVMACLVYLVARTSLWDVQAQRAQFSGQGDPPTQYFVPPAQFPGQWGYPQQQQQSSLPPQQQQLPYGQPQQFTYVPVYPNQNPGQQIHPSPGEEKDRPLPVLPTATHA